jgi:hypothetical protein
MKPKTFLFPGTVKNWRADVPITDKIPWYACQEAAQRAGIDKHVTPDPIGGKSNRRCAPARPLHVCSLDANNRSARPAVHSMQPFPVFAGCAWVWKRWMLRFGVRAVCPGFRGLCGDVETRRFSRTQEIGGIGR